MGASEADGGSFLLSHASCPIPHFPFSAIAQSSQAPMSFDSIFLMTRLRKLPTTSHWHLSPDSQLAARVLASVRSHLFICEGNDADNQTLALELRYATEVVRC